jgi:hypothetical protein
MDFGKPRSPVRDSLDAGIDEALGTISERSALRTARDPRAVQEAQRALSARKAELGSSGQQAGETSKVKPRLRDRLERMTDEEREAAIASVTPGTRERWYLEELVESIRIDEDAAELLVAQELEEQSAEQSLANVDQDGSWRAANQDEGLVDDWSSLSEAERRAEADLAAETAGPLYLGEEEFSDDIEVTYDDLEDEEE